MLTPVAELEPVDRRLDDGARRFSNEDEIRRKDIRVGDTVVIEKAGEVIPAVVRSRRTGGRPARSRSICMPTRGKCPACGGDISRDPEAAAWRCENLDCSGPDPRAHRALCLAQGDGY